MWLKPPPGRVGVRDPSSFVRMPAGGREVDLAGPDGRYWRRCLRDKDVIQGEAPKPGQPVTAVQANAETVAVAPSAVPESAAREAKPVAEPKE